MAGFYLSVRVLHVVFGAFWAGSVFFAALYFNPSVMEAGPEGGKVMGILQRRGWMSAVLVIALVTVLSGFYLLWVMSGHFSPGFMGSRSGILLSVGMLAGVIAVCIGLFGTLPANKRMGRIAAAMARKGGPPAPEDLADLTRLRDRVVLLIKVIGVLLLVAVVTMALGPHV
ncbi:MAG TPA: hypothetical protein VJ997_03900 [Longimicrobiales bacterium]|nr:hypothetical protein [Longimicrobiales bacterium]